MVEGLAPRSLKEALELLDAKHIPYAGGTELLIRGSPAPGADYLFLHRVPELRSITADNGIVSIGAGITFTELIESPHCPPLLAPAVRGIAAPGIRNLGTIGGNICNASPAGDSLPPLYLYDAVLVLVSMDSAKPTGSPGSISCRRLPIEAFIRGVRKTDLKANELLCAVEIPPAAFTHTAYEKVGARKAQAISKLSFVAAIVVEEGFVRDFRAAFGAVGTTALRCRDIEASLRGRRVAELKTDRSIIAEMVEAYSARIKPIDDQRSTAEYRKTVCLNLLKNFLGESLR
jgi:CO/xanthine dehydrogenase FAD-binding subunit